MLGKCEKGLPREIMQVWAREFWNSGQKKNTEYTRLRQGYGEARKTGVSMKPVKPVISGPFDWLTVCDRVYYRVLDGMKGNVLSFHITLTFLLRPLVFAGTNPGLSKTRFDKQADLTLALRVQ
jgi:hypothetical protein